MSRSTHPKPSPAAPSAVTLVKFEHEFGRIRRIIMMAGAATRTELKDDVDVEAVVSESLLEASDDMADLERQLLDGLKGGAR